MLAGRTAEQKAQLVKDVTEAVMKNTGAPGENIHVILRDMEPSDYAQNGQLKG